MKILFLTGSRSDWGYIKPIIEIARTLKINHKLCVTNMLLLDSFGYGVNDIKKEGFKNYMKSIGKLGGQKKIPRLANDRKIADALGNQHLAK